MLQPDENGTITVKTEQQYEAFLSGTRDDFIVLVLEVDGIVRRTTDRSVVLAERQQRESRMVEAEQLAKKLSGVDNSYGPN